MFHAYEVNIHMYIHFKTIIIHITVEYPLSQNLGHGGACLQSWLLRRWRVGGSWLKVNKCKKLVRPHINKPGMMVHHCNPSYAGDVSRRLWSEAGPSKRHKTLSEKIIKVKRNWGHGSSDRVPA
jgi:hypothetical protein